MVFVVASAGCCYCMGMCLGKGGTATRPVIREKFENLILITFNGNLRMGSRDMGSFHPVDLELDELGWSLQFLVVVVSLNKKITSK